LREILRVLARRGLSIVLVTHHLPDIIPEMERVVLIQRGKVLRDGPKREVLRSAPLSDLFEIPVEVLDRNGYYHVL
jgi:iron complex transport system ATP-binding protein